MRTEKRIESALKLFAYGDAYGYVTEFMKLDEILNKQPQVPSQLVVSDDTQMSLYTMQAIAEINEYFDFMDSEIAQNLLVNERLQNIVRKKFADTYLEFAADKDNNRAPGNTVMTSLAYYDKTEHKLTGLEGSSHNHSLGCGTVMRAPWIGLLPYSAFTLAMLSYLQAQATHGDPKGWVISAITSLMVQKMVNGQKTDENMFTEALKSLNTVENAVTQISDENVQSSIYDIRKDLTKYSLSIDGIKESLLADTTLDFNLYFGEGWIADEALYNALAAMTVFNENTENNVLTGIKRLVYSQGDSDSIAAIAGSMFGAHSETMSTQTLDKIEASLEPRYRREINTLHDSLIKEWNRKLEQDEEKLLQLKEK